MGWMLGSRANTIESYVAATLFNCWDTQMGWMLGYSTGLFDLDNRFGANRLSYRARYSQCLEALVSA